MLNVHFNWNQIELNFYNMMKFLRINGVEGDYAEFGVYKGGTLISAYHIARFSGIKNMVFFAYDSFEGLPQPKKSDNLFIWKKGDFNFSLENVKRNLKRSSVSLEKFKFIKGFYEKSLKNEHGIKKLAAVHIDCDYYESTVLVLEYIKKYLQTGTVILFDDWYCFRNDPNLGEQRAVKEFLARNTKIKFIDLPSHGMAKMFSVLIEK